MRRRTVTVAVMALTLGGLAGAGPAQASFPGTNGLIAYVSGGNIFLVDPTISPPVTQQITTIGGFNSVNWDATGKRLVADNTNAGIAGTNFLEPRSETPITLLPGTDTNDDTPAFDPTGTKIVFEESNDIAIANVDGTERTYLTLNVGDSFTNPDWSPDGQFLVFQDDTDGQIKRMRISDRSISTLTPPGAGCGAGATACQDPSYSPDGQRVAYDQDGAGVTGIYTVAADGTATTATRLSNANDDLAAYSPEGTQVAFQDQASRLALVPTDGSLVKTNVGAISTVRLSWGVKPVVTPPPPPDNQFTFGALTLNKDKGTATQTVTVPGTGVLALGGSGVAPQRPSRKVQRARRIAVTAGDVPVPIKAKGDKKKQLKKKGKVTVTASFTFTPDGGTANTLTKKITLKKTKKK